MSTELLCGNNKAIALMRNFQSRICSQCSKLVKRNSTEGKVEIMKCWIMWLLMSLVICMPSNALELYVALDGSDSNPGTIEKPFATLEGARDSIREIKRSQPFLSEGATVYIHRLESAGH